MNDALTPGGSDDGINRRSFVKAVGAAGAGLSIAAGRAAAQGQPASSAKAVQTDATSSSPPPRKRYCIVGVGSRSGMYQWAIEGPYKAGFPPASS
jgi:hypothetical protein